MIRRAGIVVSTTLAAGLLSLAVALPAFAAPKPNDDPPPPSGDPRATSHNGNATTCKGAGLEGTIILKNDSPTGKTVTINPSDLPAGFDVTGTVVKGGDAYNVYPPGVLDNLRAPDNNGGQQPDLSHWFVCGVKKTTTTTVTTPSTETSTSTSNNGGTTTTSPAAQGSNGAVSGDELANTGFSATGPLIAGSALLLIGGGLLLLLRRTRRND